MGDGVTEGVATIGKTVDEFAKTFSAGRQAHTVSKDRRTINDHNPSGKESI